MRLIRRRRVGMKLAAASGGARARGPSVRHSPRLALLLLLLLPLVWLLLQLLLLLMV